MEAPVAKDTNPRPRILGPRWDKHDSFSVEEAGMQILGMSRNKSYEAANKGQLPIVRIGRVIRVPRHALERLLTGAGA
jgi:excisionase family DNA binding protein